MPVEVKVCGLTDARSLAAAALGGARWLGFIFYPPSPRALSPRQAADLAAKAPAACIKVGVLVDPDDALLDEVLRAVPLDCLQLHGAETPARVAAIKARTGRCGDQGAEDRARRRPRADPRLCRGRRHAAVRRQAAARSRPAARRQRPRLRLAAPAGARGRAAVAALGRPLGRQPGGGGAICALPAPSTSPRASSGGPGKKDPARIRRFLEVAATLGPPAA